ncbi:MAG: two-component sensor histidine kinase [Flavobacterium sp. BFFFF2]|nr:MAG: two-component sensor histidine kinase [Flavobacterium sp. BFFFF2]
MTVKFKKTYRFAIKSSLYITGFSVATLSILLFLLDQLSYLVIAGFGFSVALFSFFVIQYRVEHFIYRRVKKIYDDVSILDATTFRNQPITTDMATLTKQVKQFARDKKMEIEDLKVREEYRREFIGYVSHELKTPLFTVQGYLETLLDGAINDIEVRDKYLERAENGVERLIHIVNDLDMITKLEAGELNLEMEHFNIVELIQHVFDLLEMKADQKNIILLFDQRYLHPISVFADKQKMQQVLINLVVNSIKYGKADGSTEVALEDLTEHKLLIRIKDNGEGIERQYIPRLFERFFRVDKTGSRADGGSGLGLSIVKHILEGHGEKIFVDSQPGQGSEFSFTLEKS